MQIIVTKEQGAPYSQLRHCINRRRQRHSSYLSTITHALSKGLPLVL